VILTSTGKSLVQPSTTFISRMFAPLINIPEDAVTGSAHCILATYWGRILNVPDGVSMLARQVSPRGGSIEVVWKHDVDRVFLRGDSCIVAKGDLYC
jgi:predicted PhzF superfamily epimerase YddE/YHI9